MGKNIFFLFFSVLFLSFFQSYSQTGTEFWLAPPNITDDHNSTYYDQFYLSITALDSDVTVIIEQPANSSFSPITVNIPAHTYQRVSLVSYESMLETKPTNTVLNTGLHITSDYPISVYFEYDNVNNPDILALKGQNALGTEFYIPLTNYAPFYNHTFGDTAYASFDIVATEDNTTVRIYPMRDVNGHTGLQQFSVHLNRGQTYSCAWTGANYQQPSTHPFGSVVLADKPIAVSIKDDSDHNPSGGCYDLMADQIVPTNIIGQDYIVVKGQLDGGESIFITSIENNTEVYVNGSATPDTILFAGEEYRIDLDGAGHERTYVHLSKPAYATHVTGFGCEEGIAILPPLNCAGSKSVSFSRSTNEGFFLTILVKNGHQNDFSVSPPDFTIDGSAFQVVPGTNDEWVAAIFDLTSDASVGQAYTIANSSTIFALGLINGGQTSGCRYGYFSEFVAEILVDAGADQTICANSFAQLNGSVSGGVTTGIWSTSGTGSFSDPTDLNATYTPSYTDIQNGHVTLTLTSTGVCFPQSDDMVLYFDPAPVVDAGPDQTVCANNASVQLQGSVTVATGGVWSGGDGTFIPDNTTLDATYVPSAAEIANGTVTLTLTSTGNGSCNAESDQMTITITPAPTVDAGSDQSVCANNPEVTLNGTVTVATGGQWTGGSGAYNPGSNALNTVYTPSQAEINNGQVTLVLTTTGNGNCLAVSDSMTITFTPSPTVDAGSDQTLCANNSDAQLDGSVSIASGGQWSGGLGVFVPNNDDLNAIYHPTSSEIASGQVLLYLTTTGNGNCNAVKDSVILHFTEAPTVDAGTDQVVCENNPEVNLNGTITIASGGIWSGGTGTFVPDNTSLNATYIPSATEIAVGHLTLTLTSTGNGNCNPVSDDMEIIINPAPIVDAGADIHACTNNPNAHLNGSVVNAGGGIWSGGSGTFSPNTTTLNATYIPTQAEINAGSVMLYLTSTDNGTCLPVKDSVTVYFDPAPVVDAGQDITVCANNSQVYLGGSVTNAGGGVWSGGLGIFDPGNTYLNTTYTPTQGEIANDSLVLTLTSTGNGSCLAESDNVTIYFTPAPTVDAGQDVTVCENNLGADLSGTITIASGGQWLGGSGNFVPSDTSLATTYYPSASEVSNGGVTLLLVSTGNGDCLPVEDSVHITINPTPIVDAGNDVYVCVDDMVAQLNGMVSGITNTGEWTTSGTGYFTPNNTTLNAQYICSSQDSIAGEVLLTLISTNNGECLPVSDSMKVYILPAGTADAGADVTVCANNSAVYLDGHVGGGASSGVWSTSGSGVFYPSDTVLNATYIPSPLDTSVGSAVLTLTANSCNMAVDTLVVTITPAPYVDAGADIITCVDNLDIQLDGHVWGATNTGEWTTSGTGYFTPNNTALNAVYHASSQDSINGHVTLVLSATGYGNCNPVSDTLEIDILPAGIVDAGQDQTLCSNNATIQLNGSISGGASEGQWATSGDGIFVPSDTVLNATYIPSQNDLAAGDVTLVLTATNSCNFAFDVLHISFTPAPIADAGADISVCANNSVVSLSGSVTIATGGQWSSLGDGLFSPDDTSLNTNYIPGPDDIAAGGVDIVLTTTGNGGCLPVKDTMHITITPAPIVDAGNNQTVCNTASYTSLNGSVTGGASTGEWTTLGDGYFTPNDSDLNANYVFGTNDTTNGIVRLILTSTNYGNCLPVSDTITLTFTGETFADAGEDFYVCLLDSQIYLNGFVAGGAVTGYWQTIDGTGYFVDSTQLNAVYNVAEADRLQGFVNFVLTADNGGGCQPGKDTVKVTFVEPPQVNAGENIEACLGADTIPLGGTANNVIGIQWQTLGSGSFYPSDTVLNNYYIPSSSDSVNGQVTLILSSRNSVACSEVSDTVKIFFVVPIVPDFTNSVACKDNVVTLSDNSQIITGSISGYVWNIEGETSEFYGNPVQYVFDSVGIYNVALTVYSSLGCSYTVTKPVTVYPTPQVDFSYVSNCYKDSVTFTDLSNVNQGYINNWTWVFGDGDTAYVQNPQHLYDMASNYNVSLIVTSNVGCSGEIIKPIVVYSLPEADFDYSYNCADNVVSFIDQTSSPVNNVNYWNWNFGDGQIDNTQNPQHIFDTQGIHTVTLIAGTSPNCVDTISKDVTTYDIIAEFSYENKCAYDSVPFVDMTNTYGDPATYLWNFGDGNTSVLHNPRHLYNSDGTYEVSLSVTTVSGCTDTVSKNITVYPVPSAAFTYDAEEMKVNIPVSFSDASTDAVAWIWNFGDGATANVPNPQHIFTNSGNMNVMLIVSNEYSCVDTAYTSLYIEPEAQILPPKLPNAFSPNDDGMNDVFYPRGGPFKKIDFAVYNSWGIKVFHTTKIDEGWDGTYKGVPQPVGTYVWTIEAETLDGKLYKKTGDVTLIR